jgi:hypothetical protein
MKKGLICLSIVAILMLGVLNVAAGPSSKLTPDIHSNYAMDMREKQQAYIFGGHVSTAGEGGQHMPSHSTSLAEGVELSGASDNRALRSELGQNGHYKSPSTATSVPRAGGGGMQAPRSSKLQYDLITFVNCPFYVWGRFPSSDPTYYANKPAELYRWNSASSQWEKIRDGTTNAGGLVEFLGLKEGKPVSTTIL